MRKSIVILFVFWSFLGYSQNDIYCLNDFAGWYRLSTINPTTGAITEIAPIPVVAFYVLGNKQCINSHDSTYTFAGHDGANVRLYTVHLGTGAIISDPLFNNNVVGLQYNCNDSTIYATEEFGGNYYLVTVDKTTGLTVQKGIIPGVTAYVGDGFTLDVKRGMYHLFGLFNSNIHMYSIDINTGAVINSPMFPDNLTGLAYNCNDSIVYGLWEDGTDFKLERINPSSGNHSTIGVLDSLTPGFVVESASINRNGMYTYRGFSSSNSLSLITLDVQTASVIDTIPFTNNVSGIDYYVCCSDTQVAVGVSEVEVEALKVYPNPFIEKVELKWGKKIKSGFINLFDIYGRLVFNDSKINGDSYLLRRNGLAKGVYFVEVNDGSQFSWSEKLIAR